MPTAKPMSLPPRPTAGTLAAAVNDIPGSPQRFADDHARRSLRGSRRRAGAAALAAPGSTGAGPVLTAALEGAANGFACSLLALAILPLLEQALNDGFKTHLPHEPRVRIHTGSCPVPRRPARRRRSCSSC